VGTREWSGVIVRVDSHGGDAGSVENSGSVPATALLPTVVDYANRLSASGLRWPG